MQVDEEIATLKGRLLVAEGKIRLLREAEERLWAHVLRPSPTATLSENPSQEGHIQLAGHKARLGKLKDELRDEWKLLDSLMMNHPDLVEVTRLAEAAWMAYCKLDKVV